MRDSQRNFFLKNNFFNKEYEGIYMKSTLKNNQCYIDNEKNRDLIIKLKEKIIAKDKEISDLKVLKRKKDNEYHKTMKLLEQIVKEEELEERRINKNKKSASSKNIYKSNYNVEERFKPIYSKDDIIKNETLDINKEGNINQKDDKMKLKGIHMKKINEILNNYLLKQKIEQQNKLLIKKEKEIEELKFKQKVSNISQIKNNYIQNINELKMMERQNEYVINQNNEMAKQNEILEEDKKELIYSLEKINEDFRNYQLSKEKEMEKLKNQIAYSKEKNQNNKIMGKKIASVILNKNKIEKENMRKNNSYNNITNFAEVENGIKKMSEEMSFLKQEKYSKDEKIKLLNHKIEKLTEDRNKLNIQLNDFISNLEKNENKRKKVINENQKLHIKINQLDKQLQKEKEEKINLLNNLTKINKKNNQLKK